MKDLDFEHLYNHHWEKLYAFCYKMTRDAHISQNIVQDVFMDLWERRKKVQVLSLENYLFRAAKNQILKEYRKNKFDTTVIEEEFENYIIENIDTLDAEILEKLHRLLDSLSEKKKEILLLNKIEELSIDEIALRLNISKQTVKNQLSSALKQLKNHAAEITLLIVLTIL
ncbi:RNA polymerase sigma factor [Pedobacter antarcticus]|uniref:RNA polymerase sigma factor n=1 Tax=Pedobacter antarcticus TaxID=34086 RepID=UPI00292CEFDE|nr:sigma-70 family RNA polymerase sigma factor [Pedobacter antarcticus]